MRFCLTGHKGLIGSSLLKRLTEQGHQAVALFDLRDDTDIRFPVNDQEADVLFHLAAFCTIRGSILHPSKAFTHNVGGTYAMLEYARRNHIKKIVYTSSTRVLYPEKNPYTASKVYGEELVKAYSQCYDMDYVIVRPSTVYGPFDDQTHRLIDLWMRAVLQNKPLNIYGTIDKTLDFTYVDDFVDGLMLASQQSNQEFDIASGKSERLIYVAEKLVEMAGSKSPIDFHLPELAQPQEVEVDISAIQKLGYVPKVDIIEGMKRTLEFYRTLNVG